MDENFAEVIEIDIDEIVPNEWNPNKQDEIIFNELTRDIKEEGFDEPIQVVKIKEDDKLYEEGKRYKIIGEEHRYKSVKVLGWERIPAVIKEYENENTQKEKTVRRNLLKGDLDKKLFTKLINSLDPYSELTPELSRRLGFKNEDEAKKYFINEKGKYNEEYAEKLKETRTEELAIANLSLILNKLFAEFGDTVQQNFMFFTYGTKLHLMVMMNRKIQKMVDGVIERAKKKGENINDLLEKILELGIEGTKGITISNKAQDTEAENE